MFSAGPAIWTFSAGDLALPYGHEFGMTKWSPLIWSYAESISNTFMHGREREWQHESMDVATTVCLNAQRISMPFGLVASQL